MKLVNKFWVAIGGRKFIVLVLATAGLCAGKLMSSDWVIVAGMYLGFNVLQKFIAGKKEE